MIMYNDCILSYIQKMTQEILLNTQYYIAASCYSLSIDMTRMRQQQACDACAALQFFWVSLCVESLTMWLFDVAVDDSASGRERCATLPAVIGCISQSSWT